MCAEFECSWVAGLVERLDYIFARESTYDSEKNLIHRRPSEYFHSNIFFTFEDDRAGVLTTPLYGEDNYLWGSDYPHHTGTWPYSQQALDADCQGFSPGLARKLGWDNAARVYGIAC